MYKTMFLVLISLSFASASLAQSDDSADGIGRNAPPSDRTAFLSDIPQQVSSERTKAIHAAADTVSGVSQHRLLRSRAVSVEPKHLFVESTLNGTPSPAETLTLSVFPGVTFVVQNTKHHYTDTLRAWLGTITKGGTGTVEIQLVARNAHEDVAFVNIASDVGNFSIAPTKTLPYYVVVETYRDAEVKVDADAETDLQ